MDLLSTPRGSLLLFRFWAFLVSGPPETALMLGAMFRGHFRRAELGIFSRQTGVDLFTASGDLVYVGTQPRPANSPWTTQQQGKETRRAPFFGCLPAVGLLEAVMIRGRDDRGQLHVRLVQDYGRPEDPDAPRAATKKSRGRPKAA